MVRNEDSSHTITLQVVATACTGKGTDTLHISGHFLFYLQQKTEQKEYYFFNLSDVHKNTQSKQLLYLRVNRSRQ